MKELGKGAFGTVCKVRRKADGMIYAMKRVKISQLNPKERENALNEVRILASLTHQNIIGYKQAFFEEDSKTLNIVMEFADDGDLDSKIQSHIKAKTSLPENEIWQFLIQMVSGLKALHDNKIMHRDLKCANIFLMKGGALKLGDLNVSKVVKMQLAYTQTGTPYYASPEVWSDKPYDYKSDLWSVGAVIYELCALKPPFRGQGLQELYRNIMRGVYDPIPKTYTKELSSMISLMLQVNPTNRPNCDQILNNPMIIKRLDYGKNAGKAQYNMIGTIKMPRNMNEINQKLPKGQFGQINIEEKKKSNENLIKVEEDPFINQMKNMQNKDQNMLKRPDSAKYIPPQKIEAPKQQNYIPSQNSNNILKQNPTPIVKTNAPVSNNSNIYQKPQNIVQNNVNNNILMRNDKPQPISNNEKKVRPSSARPEEKNIPLKQIVPNQNNYNYNYQQGNNYKQASPTPLNNQNNVNNNLLIKKNDISPKDNKQYKYESPYLKNVANNVNPVSKQNVVLPKSNNNNVRPISSKVENNQKILVNHNVNVNNNVVNSIKKVVVPEKKIGNQIKIAENLIKNNNYNYNYNNNVKSNNQPQNNFLRPSSGQKVEPVKVANHRIIIKK
jgi:NIMA (never in mitosis gene a)-related kinase